MKILTEEMLNSAAVSRYRIAVSACPYQEEATMHLQSKSGKTAPYRGRNPEHRQQRPVTALIFLLVLFMFGATAVHAVPETNAVRVTDVTPASFSLVWMTDVAADPGVEVYSDMSMQQRVTEGLIVTPMPAGSSVAAQSARIKGIMKARVTGVHPSTTYYVRTVTKDSSNPDSISYSGLQEVRTASSVALYRTVNNAPQALSNDLMAIQVYVRPADQAAEPRLGDLILFQEQGASYPVSAFTGDGAVSPEGVIDMNNVFGTDGTSLPVIGGETIILRIYRGGNLAALSHYRRTPVNSAVVSFVGPVKGFFADINLDGKIDDLDFEAFKAQYRTLPNDVTYNPDYNFVDDPEGKVDVREFGKFSREYGRTNVQ